MAIKTFSVGEVLTSTDTNTYLANAGLVYVKSQTVGNGVSSVVVPSAFSTDYDNYRIIYSGGVGSTVQGITMSLTGSLVSYYGNLFGASFVNTTVSANPVDNQTSWLYAGVTSTVNCHLSADLHNPFLAKVTTIQSNYLPSATNGFIGYFGGFHNVASSYTGFTLSVPGTITGGTITVYGYRKA